MPGPKADYTGVYHKLELQEQFASDLWRSVVAQAIRDMDLGREGARRTPESIRAELEAIQWIDTEDFEECCDLALIDHIELRSRLGEILVMKHPYRRLMLRDLADMLRDPPPKLSEDDPSLATEYPDLYDPLVE